jgi:hypothetical protein
MKHGGAWPFGSRSNVSAVQAADNAVGRAAVVEQGARGAQTGIAVASALGVTAALGAGPLLPVVVGTSILVAIGLRMYAQNKKLTVLFKRTSRLLKRLTSVLTSMKDAEERNAFQLDTSDVDEDIKELQRTIGELIGPEAFKEIENTGVKPEERNTLMSRINRFVRRVAPESTIRKFNEQLIQLALDFSVLQGEFAIKLEGITTALAAEIAKAGKTPPPVAPDVTEAKKGANNPPPPTGGRKTRRRRGRKQTRKNSS